MPTYEYICQECGAKFECRRTYDHADDEIHCSVCKSSKTKRTLSKFFVRNQSGISSQNKSGCSNCSGGSCSSCNH